MSDTRMILEPIVIDSVSGDTTNTMAQKINTSFVAIEQVHQETLKRVTGDYKLYTTPSEFGSDIAINDIISKLPIKSALVYMNLSNNNPTLPGKGILTVSKSYIGDPNVIFDTGQECYKGQLDEFGTTLRSWKKMSFDGHGHLQLTDKQSISSITREEGKLYGVQSDTSTVPQGSANIKKVEIQDSTGNIIYPHTSSSSVFNSKGENLETLINSIQQYVNGLDLSWDGITNKPTTFPPSTHNHNNEYHTKAEIASLLSGKLNNSGANTLEGSLNITTDLTVKDNKVYHRGDKPTKADVGLSNVNNWSATDSVSDASTSTYATASAVKKAYDKANHTHPYLPVTGGTVSGSIDATNLLVNGNNVYHTGNKPTPEEIGASDRSHGHTDLIPKTSIKNTLTEVIPGSVLDATQGKILADKLNEHNSSNTAHSDIRNKAEELGNKINNHIEQGHNELYYGKDEVYTKDEISSILTSGEKVSIKYEVYTIDEPFIQGENGQPSTFTYHDYQDNLYTGVIGEGGEQIFELKKGSIIVGLNRIEATIDDTLSRSVASGGLVEFDETHIGLTERYIRGTEVTFKYYEKIDLPGHYQVYVGEEKPHFSSNSIWVKLL